MKITDAFCLTWVNIAGFGLTKGTLYQTVIFSLMRYCFELGKLCCHAVLGCG